MCSTTTIAFASMRPLCEKLSFPTHGYRLLRGRSRYQMAPLSESPKHPMRCVRDLTVHGSSQNVRALLMAPNPKCTSKGSNLNQKFFCGNRPRGVTVSTLDSESSDRGSNPREVSRQILKNELKRECNIVLDSTIASLQCVFCGNNLSSPRPGCRLW